MVGCYMMHPYITMKDNTEVLFSDVTVLNGVESITVYFERPVVGGFVDAKCVLPSYKWNVNGMSLEEIAKLQAFVEKNADLMVKFAKKGGVGVA